jgi:hypothetical protein
VSDGAVEKKAKELYEAAAQSALYVDLGYPANWGEFTRHYPAIAVNRWRDEAKSALDQEGADARREKLTGDIAAEMQRFDSANATPVPTVDAVVQRLARAFAQQQEAIAEEAMRRYPPDHEVDDPFGETGVARSDPYGYNEDARERFIEGAQWALANEKELRA